MKLNPMASPKQRNLKSASYCLGIKKVVIDLADRGGSAYKTNCTRLLSASMYDKFIIRTSIFCHGIFLLTRQQANPSKKYSGKDRQYSNLVTKMLALRG